MPTTLTGTSLRASVKLGGLGMTLSVDNRFLRKTIERALRDLPALPAAVAKILAEIENPNVSAAQLEKLIATDQALASRVLRVVNSAYYGLSGQVSSLSQAIVILGIQQIRNLVLSVGAISNLHPRTQRQRETMQQFWQHSFGTAAATESILRFKGAPQKDIETAFVGGLLHDIGRLFLFVNFTEIYDDLIRYSTDKCIPVEEAEMAFMGLTHCEVGAEMASHWKLPSSITSLIAHHEGPFTVDDDPMILAVHLGDWLTKQAYYPEHLAEICIADPVACEWLQMTELELEELRMKTKERIQDAAHMLGLEAA